MYTGIFLGSVYGGEGYTDKSVLVKGFYLGVQLPQKGLIYFTVREGNVLFL